MARKAFLLRVDPALLADLQRWADDDLRSLNGQIEYLLRQAVTRRTKKPPRDRGEPAKVAEPGKGAKPGGAKE